MTSENEYQAEETVADVDSANVDNIDSGDGNVVPAEPVTDSPPEPVRLTPGALLSAQRETLELTLKQVADKLNLTMHYVRALESDNYDKLPGDVFVRGYIRSYSNLLQLDPLQVIAVYNEFTSHKLARKEEAIKRHARRRKDKNRPWIVVSGVAFVGVALALWYFNTGGSAEDRVPAAGTVPGATTGAAIPVFEGNTGLAPPPMAESAATPNAPDLTAEDIDLFADGFAAEETGLHDTDAGGGLSDETGADNASSLIPAAESNGVIALDWNGDDSLQLLFTADSWVEIEDRGGAGAHRELRQSGETLQIRGTAPFSILLGNARAASLIFNGRTMDISSNIRADDTARLSIGM